MVIIYPDSGTNTFHNQNGKEIPRHKIGYLPEERGLYKNVKVMDILLYLADLKDYPLRSEERRVGKESRFQGRWDEYDERRRRVTGHMRTRVVEQREDME